MLAVLSAELACFFCAPQSGLTNSEDGERLSRRTARFHQPGQTLVSAVHQLRLMQPNPYFIDSEIIQNLYPAKINACVVVKNTSQQFSEFFPKFGFKIFHRLITVLFFFLHLAANRFYSDQASRQHCCVRLYKEKGMDEVHKVHSYDLDNS